MKEHTLKYLKDNIKSSDSFSWNEVTVKTVGQWLCGMNYHLAEEPFSQDFLCNVAYNSRDCMWGILWLQLQHT